jgi:hypothetical protein
MFTIPSDINNITNRFYDLVYKNTADSIEQYVNLLFELYNSENRKFMSVIEDGKVVLKQLPLVKLASGRIPKSLYNAIYDKFKSFAIENEIITAILNQEDTIDVSKGLHITNMYNHFDLYIGMVYEEVS